MPCTLSNVFFLSEIRFDHLRILADRVGDALGDGHPVVEHLYVLGEPEDEVHPVFDDDYGEVQLGAIKERREKMGKPMPYYIPDEEALSWAELYTFINTDWAAECEAKGLPGNAILADAYAFAEEFARESSPGA